MSKTSILAAVALILTAVAPAVAQMGGAVEGAIAAGQVGEQADGYLGIVRGAPGDLKAQVDAINIKRREGYTQVAQSRNVPIEAFAASIGCKTLSNLREGRAYSVARGVWATKGDAPVALPPQCGN